MTNSSFDCRPQLPQFPIEILNGAGGVINQNETLICGGLTQSFDAVGDCYSLGPNKEWAKVAKLSTPRYNKQIPSNSHLLNFLSKGLECQVEMLWSMEAYGLLKVLMELMN